MTACTRIRNGRANTVCLHNGRMRGTPSHMSTHPLYKTWASMIQRCTNPKRDSFPIYGGRGIRVCDRWRTFAHFLFDMGERPSPKHTLDRINPDGHYEPGNCRWATPKEQTETRRKKPTRICVRCGKSPNGKARNGLCPACSEYQRRNGTARPVSAGERAALRVQKIAAACSKSIHQRNEAGEVIATHPSAASAARALNQPRPTSINNALNGRSKSAHGFRWTYA